MRIIFIITLSILLSTYSLNVDEQNNYCHCTNAKVEWVTQEELVLSLYGLNK